MDRHKIEKLAREYRAREDRRERLRDSTTLIILMMIWSWLNFGKMLH